MGEQATVEAPELDRLTCRSRNCAIAYPAQARSLLRVNADDTIDHDLGHRVLSADSSLGLYDCMVGRGAVISPLTLQSVQRAAVDPAVSRFDAA